MSQTEAARKPLVIRNANFRRLWISSTAGIFGGAVTSVALPVIAVTELDASNFTVAVLAGMTFLPWLLFGLPIGVLVDRYRRRPIIVASLAVRTLLLASLPVAWWLDLLTVVQLFAVSFGAGLAAVFFTLAEQALVPSAVAREELVEGNGLMTGSGAFGDAGGRALGGWVTGAWGASNALLLQVAASLGSLAAILRLDIREPRPDRPKDRRVLRDMGEGVRYVFSTLPLRMLLVTGALWNLGGNIVVSLLVLLVIRSLGETPGMLGLLTAATAVGGTLGGLSVKRIASRVGSGRVWRYSMFPAVAGYASLLLISPGWGMTAGFIGLFVAGFAISLNIVVSTTFRQRACPPQMLGRLGSAQRMITWGMLALAAFAAGILVELVGIRGAILTGILVAALAPLAAALGPLRRVRDLEDLEPEGTAGKPAGQEASRLRPS
ncbi:MFS transporter [Arthrobacter sp. zg-Y20]|uniref:MFS transporter n=1 Tax=unclassified Arthrobacter TaxID=235627 RepID=UPI001D143C16|nr:MULTISPECIES: MFS transporter [unclassified Arthrobacter]MCC3275043.1 MFS transporter [Arthrobacter sp. zg-Y20]MDK1315200.1 MFS transporter [Arthrobacter sp. zg.Y20]WIB05038.1 MFS transporter [Arthrobacter sp. zg-Y20]